MPPKDDVNVIDGTLYFEDESGELKPIYVASELSEVEITEDMDAEVLGNSWFQFVNNVLYTDHNCEDLVPGLFSMQPEYHVIGFDLDKLAYKMLVRIHQNNYRRLHGLRPVRHKVWRHNPFAAKRMGKLFRRGGFK